MITPPQPDQESYTYTLGEPALQAKLNGPWMGDNACCKIEPQMPQIEPSDYPAGLFRFSDDRLTLSIEWIDLPKFGPES